MPKITALNTFVAGTTTSADDVADNFYNNDSAITSFSAINGQLDSNNKGSWTVANRMIRPNSLAKGKMVGTTGNLDYVPSVFSDDNADDGAYQPVPGCGISFFLPYAPSVCILTWQITFAGGLIYGDSKQLELRMYIDDVVQNRQFRVLPEGRVSSTRYLNRDRTWNGHVTKTNLTSGWHTAHVACFLNQNTARIRIRNMKYIYFK